MCFGRKVKSKVVWWLKPWHSGKDADVLNSLPNATPYAYSLNAFNSKYSTCQSNVLWRGIFEFSQCANTDSTQIAKKAIQ